MEVKDLLLSDGWQFCLTKNGTSISELDDIHWYDVEVPHDWLIGDTGNLYADGCGWYKNNINITAEQAAGRVFINFDGVYMNSTVYVNGVEAGSWTYGYSAFEYDITELLHEGDNSLLVCVRHEAPNSRWYSGAGIFRDVTLKFRNKTYIACNSVYIHTIPPEFEDDCWEAEVEVKVAGEMENGMTISAEFLSPDGKRLVGARGSFDVKHTNEWSFEISDPLIWDIESPQLYTICISLYDEKGETLDCVFERFGFRSVEFSPEKGFVLNERQLKLHGVCMHHDLGALGAAYNYSALYRQLKTMKNMGVNALRTSHNMPVKQLMYICDELGILVDCESFDMWEISKTEFDNHRFFKETAERDVKSWVERDRNHPCLIMWSIGNEISDTNDPHGIEIAEKLAGYVKKYDPKGNALPTIASNYMGNETAQKCMDVVKIAGYNYAENLYEEHHKKYPDWCIYGSETSSAVRSRGIYKFPADVPQLISDDLQCSSLDNSYVGWGCSARKAWRLDRDCKFCAGEFIWTGFDYIGEPTPYTTKNSYFGAVDTAGFPKDIYYFYQSVWRDPKDKPVLHIAPSYWDFNEGDLIDVIIYSNLHHVELLLNDELIGSHEMKLDTDSEMRAHFKVEYKPGRITANGYDKNGTLVKSESLQSCGDPAKIVLSTDKAEIFGGIKELAFIEISVTDKEGVPVGNARNRVKVEVSGVGKLIGLDNGDSTDYDSYKGDNRRLFGGKLLAIVGAVGIGEITVKASSIGLEPAELKIGAGECYGYISAVMKNEFPVKRNEYTDEVPVRKIETRCAQRNLNKDNPSAEITVSLLPENSTYSDISWKCVRENGSEANIAEITYEGDKATVTALGDGEFIARAFVNNGADHPEVSADVRFSVTGMGAAFRSAYEFIGANSLDSSNIAVSTVENGALGNFDGRTVMTYKNIDFGTTGSQTIALSIGACCDAPVEIWEGTPENGEPIAKIVFKNNGLWNSFKASEFELAKRLTGVKSISVVIDKKIIFGGFSFNEINRAADVNFTAECDGIYGDEYKITGRSITGIGNNVIINYNSVDFGEKGVNAIVIHGSTENDKNAVQFRFTPKDGDQNNVFLYFEKSDSERRFEIPELKGIYDISFVFLPGSKFDFDWFRFE